MRLSRASRAKMRQEVEATNGAPGKPRSSMDAGDDSVSGRPCLCEGLRLLAAQLSEYLLLVEPLWEIGALVFVYLSVLDVIPAYPWLGLAAGAMPFPLRWLRYGYVARRTPFDLPIALLLLAGLVGILVSSDRGLSWGVYQSCLMCALSYYSFTSYERPQLLVKVVLLLAPIALVLLGVYVFLQSAPGTLPSFYERPIPLPLFSELQSWVDPDPLPLPSGWVSPPLKGASCGLTVGIEVVIVTLAGVALFPGRRTHRIVAGGLAVLLLCVLAISLCRAAWLVMGIGMILLMTWRSRWLILTLPAWLGVAYWSVTARTNYSLSQIWEAATNAGGKVGLWKNAASLVADHPLVGVGLGGYALPYCENSYLRFYLDFGLLGAVAVTAAAIVFVVMAFRIQRSRPNPWRGLAIGLCIAIVVAAVYSISESAPACIVGAGVDRDHYAVSFLFPVLAAALVAAYRGCTIQTANSERGAEKC